ncbi:MAG: DUF2807 domain-containing protein [Bacteroidaceae bacterium]|nr:DUF2807 domain-containing protein [Bacteroidaceae bacterium]
MKYIYLLFYITLLIGCANNRQKNISDNNLTSNIETKIVRTVIPFTGDFCHITNMGCINIEFTTGPCGIVVEGPEQLVKIVNASVDCGVLMLSLSHELDQDVQIFQGNHDITAYISCPQLKTLAIGGIGTFHSSRKILTDDITIGTMSTSNITIDSLECNSLRYEILSKGNCSISNLHTKTDCSIISSDKGKCAFNNIEIEGTLTIDDVVGSNIYCRGKTANLVINNQGDGLCKFEGSFATKSISKGPKAQIEVNGLLH